MPKKKRKKKNQKQIKGFTLIELLAVITILGILMLVAIPNITRTIENSRKDTFADVAQAYINAVKTAVAADELVCCKGTSCTLTNDGSISGGTWEKISTVSGSCIAFIINTGSTRYAQKWVSQTTGLMESGGKSPWGNAEVYGRVRIMKNNSKYTYNIALKDDNNHLINPDGATDVNDQNLSRSDIQINTNNGTPSELGFSSCYLCTIS